MQKSNQAIYSILAMLTVWVVIHTVKLNTVVPDYKTLVNKVDVLLERVKDVESFIDKFSIDEGLKEYEELYKEQSEHLESFNTRFGKMRSIHGSGYLFNWNGNLYTTYYAEETTNNKTQR